MTDQEFYEWLQTCPTPDWLVVHKEGELRTVNFIVDKEPSYLLCISFKSPHTQNNIQKYAKRA